MPDEPRIALNSVPTTIHGIAPTTTLLDWLRDHARMRGTKEGCAEGDCGACAVVLERPAPDGRVRREVVNACLTMVGQIAGMGVRTVEGLLAPDGALHPVQSALANSGSTQCGFCTPGFVMSAYAFVAGKESAEPARVHDALAGNLCRCTGYRPIVDAVLSIAPLAADPMDENSTELYETLATIVRGSGTSFEFGSDRFYIPTSLTDALELRAKYPQATLLAGGTDLGLLPSQKRERIPQVIYLGRVPELAAKADSRETLLIGAGVTYTGALDVLAKNFPTLEAYWTRIGSRQIRNMGTIGGNIGTASPIGDTLPILLALDAQIRLNSKASGPRHVAAEKFFLGYRKTELKSDELIEAVSIPKLRNGELVFADKISKRRDQDISTVCGAYYLALEGEVIKEVRIAFGGLAATVKRAYKAEQMLVGRALSEEAFSAAGAALLKDFQPISDWRGSSEYRALLAKNLLRRLYLRVAQPDFAVECDAL
jgi:xanthine dehydrogenase small subunit